MTTKTTPEKAVWFVRRAVDNRIRCTDGLWRHNTGCIESIKFYSSCGRATKYGLKGVKGKPTNGNLEEIGTAFAVYPTDSIDCLGTVTSANGRIR